MITTLTLGGAERVISNLANMFASLPDWDVYFIVKYPSKEEYPLHPKIKRVNLFNEVPCENLLTVLFKQLWTIRKVCQENNIDILVNFMAASNLKGILATLGMKTKCIVSVRDDPNVAYGKLHLKILAKLLFHLADGIVFQTHDEANWFGNKISNNSRIIPNPVSRKFYIPDDEYKKISERKNIVAVGRLEWQKNHKMLVECFAKIKHKYPSEKLVIYGRGTKYDELKAMIKQYNLQDDVNLAGEVKNIQEYIKDAKMFVMTSNHEGIPNAMLEAMALGLPVICTDCPAGGPREYILDGVDGLLVKVGSVDSLEKSMEQLLNDEELRCNLGIAARRKAKSFSEDVVFNKWYDYIRERMKA
ncbi:MAG: glycosyltransferase family 4 protein [Butyrivibrio sp.]|nr:glycosyltransferase family 4 protein [Butyrivibrio sp.]